MPVSQLSFNEAIKYFSIHDCSYIRCFKPRPEVLDHFVRMEDITSYLLAPVSSDSIALDVFDLFQLLLLSND